MPALRILVIEDHALQRLVMVRALNQLGYQQVLEAADGPEALMLLHTQGVVDVVLCCLRMTGMDGLMFLREAGRHKLVRSVIVCGELAPDLRSAVEQIVMLHGCELLGDIGKPLDKHRLCTLLDRFAPLRKATLVERMSVGVPGEYDVRRAIERQELRAYFQPKFMLKTGETIGAEVLVRWVKADGRVFSPADFLPVVERCGLLDAMFLSLLDQGLRLQRHVQSHGKRFKLAFNLHISQMSSARLIEQIKERLKQHALPASGLQFELTEDGLLEAPAACLESMVRLRMMGCGLSIDDFGVGYSSLERLCQMPFNEVKLDGGFVRNMQEQPRYLAVVSSTLALAHELGMLVVAEGLETEAQLQCLTRMGCNLGQGYYLARPMNWVQTAAWLLQVQPLSHTVATRFL